MIDFVTGDILDADAEALVNTVNCVGIMGRGVALQFKNAFPENFTAYSAACKQGMVEPGKMFVYETNQLNNPKLIINFPTKRHWRGKSRIEDIEAGLTDLADVIRARSIRTIAIPPLGSGLGGLDWSDVRPRIETALRELANLKVTVFEPAPGDKPRTISRDIPKMTAGRAALIVLMHRYLAGLMDPFITLLELHKLMYFLQAAGEPLRLRYVKATHGPYAENLRHVLRSVEGHFIAGYADGGDDPTKHLELVPGATRDADFFLGDHRATRERFDRVSDLVQGFETPFGLELLATVHWIMVNEGSDSFEDTIARTYAWGERKKRFSRGQVRLAIETLKVNQWVGQGTHPAMP